MSSRTGCLRSSSPMALHMHIETPLTKTLSLCGSRLTALTARLILRGLRCRKSSTTEINRSWLMVSYPISVCHSHPVLHLTPSVFYNDENPNGTTTSGGAHAKGVIATDGESGFWLVHSVPKYPDLSADSFTWTASKIYGQSFLCISLSHKNLDLLAKQILLMQPAVFAESMPAALAAEAPYLTKLANNENVSFTADDYIADFTSLGGQNFTSFAKSPEWGMDLYAGAWSNRIHGRMIFFFSRSS